MMKRKIKYQNFFSRSLKMYFCLSFPNVFVGNQKQKQSIIQKTLMPLLKIFPPFSPKKAMSLFKKCHSIKHSFSNTLPRKMTLFDTFRHFSEKIFSSICFINTNKKNHDTFCVIYDTM